MSDFPTQPVIWRNFCTRAARLRAAQYSRPLRKELAAYVLSTDRESVSRVWLAHSTPNDLRKNRRVCIILPQVAESHAPRAREEALIERRRRFEDVLFSLDTMSVEARADHLGLGLKIMAHAKSATNRCNR